MGINMKRLYYGGDIITMKSRGDLLQAVVVEDGRIIYTGKLSAAEALCGIEAEKINLAGKTLMPAFIDAHSHFLQTAQSVFACDLSETSDFEEIREALKAYLQEHKCGPEDIVFGVGYDHNFLKEERHPDIRLLDSVSEVVPIYISHVSGHMGVANSALLKLTGITENTPEPEGGHFGRNEDRSLNGLVEESGAMAMVLVPVIPKIRTDMMRQLKMAQELYLKNGITTVQEGAGSGQGLSGFMQYAASGELKLDCVMYILELGYEQCISALKDYEGSYKNRIKIAGAKLVLDGSPQGKTAWLSRPYEGEGEYCGYPTHDNAYVEQAVLKAVKGHYQILAHCNGDAASQQFLESYEKALETVQDPDEDLRPVMIHCQIVREDQLDRMAKIRMIPSIFIGHTYYWGDIHLKNLGSDRGANISPVRSALERGLVYNFHQDTPVTKPDMLHSVWCAVNRITRKGQLIGQHQCVDVYDALKGVTINAAYAYHEENIKGTLEVGKLADMIILDANPLKVNKLHIKDIKVLETIKEGKTVYRAVS